MNSLEQLRSGALDGARRLKLAAGLREFPPEIFALAETLEVLDLSGNALTSLPDELPSLRKLRILFCSDNQFTALPEVLGQCPQLSMVGFRANRIGTVPARALPAQLRWLVLTDNQIAELPAGIGQCTRLQKLMLAGNRLMRLPEELAACSRLELLRIAANRLGELPAWLLTMPRLAWLAYAGNPFCAPLEAAGLRDAIAEVPWHELALDHQLGEGASGVIHRADWRADGAARPVAVKLFKGAVTSDGLPLCEMAARIHGGEHANLIPVLGRVTDHPAGVQGLVMPLIDPTFRNLAGPPSLESCTRDTYAAETRFDLEALLGIAHGVAAAASHLHRRGILHGDLYGHNILHCGRGRATLGDFGAASFFAPAAQPLAQGLQRLEVRAFGCLLEELLERCATPATPPEAVATLATLADLAAACLSEDVDARPLFADIERTIAALAAEPQARH